VGDMHEMADMKRVAIDQVTGKLVNVGFDLRIAIGLGISLTPTGNTRVG